MMSYFSVLKTRTTRNTLNKMTEKQKLVQILEHCRDIQIIKFHPSHEKDTLVYIMYKNSTFEFIRDTIGWEIVYDSLIHKRIDISTLTDQMIIPYLDQVLRLSSAYEYGDLSSSSL